MEPFNFTFFFFFVLSAAAWKEDNIPVALSAAVPATIFLMATRLED